MLIARKMQYFARIINRDFIFKDAKMKTMFLTITITIQIPEPPTSDGGKCRNRSLLRSNRRCAAARYAMAARQHEKSPSRISDSTAGRGVLCMSAALVKTITGRPLRIRPVPVFYRTLKKTNYNLGQNIFPFKFLYFISRPLFRCDIGRIT